jgi:arylsulfatase A-like enzyme/cytochrome c-type biogenesis protein CcmH/NrfG
MKAFYTTCWGEVAAKRFEMTMAVNRWLLFVMALVASAMAAPPKAPSSKPKSPNIILITLDTTRADRMGFLGSARGLTPNLDALAKQSAVFTRAYAQAPLTPPSHATILTGTYPQFHQVNAMQTPLAADLPYAPQILRANGYSTAAIIGSIVLEAKAPYAPGFDRGFQTYDADFRNGNPGEDRYRTVQRRGDVVVAHALAWLDQHPRGPFFLWVHLYDAHDPYDPPEPYKSRYASEPYDGGIAYEDAVVGKLLRQLKLRGLYDGAVLAVMADHGESLGAHGEDAHGFFLYDETIHVPLLIKLPNASGGGNSVENQVELVDVLPTLLQECGIEIPKQVQGESLLPLMKRGAAEGTPTAEAWRERTAYAQSEYPRDEYGWSDERALRTGKYLYIQVPRRELYDRAADPKAERNLASTSPAVADTLANQLEAFRQKTSNKGEAPKATLDPGAQDALGALGYLASGRDVAKESPADQTADPKDKIEIGNMVHRAQALQAGMHYDEAIALLEQAIAKEPGLRLYPMLGHWLMLKQDYQNAVPVLRKALEFVPDSEVTRFQLARALMDIKDYDGAIPELENLVAKQPSFVKAHAFLGMAYARTNRLPDAIQECKIVLGYDPGDYESYMLLGYALPRTGDPQGAVVALRKAASIQPKVPLPHVWLADIYDQLGQEANAQRERLEAKRLAANASPGAKPGPTSR